MMFCSYRCHEIGGPYIAENPNCPIHGEGGFDIDEARSVIERLCERLENHGDISDDDLNNEARGFL